MGHYFLDTQYAIILRKPKLGGRIGRGIGCAIFKLCKQSVKLNYINKNLFRYIINVLFCWIDITFESEL